MAQLAINKNKELGPMQSSPHAQTVVPEDEWYDLLPVEKKLIGYSLTLGVVLLVVFIFAFGVFK